MIVHEIAVRSISNLICGLPKWMWNARQKRIAAIQQRRQLAALSICVLTAFILISMRPRQ